MTCGIRYLQSVSILEAVSNEFPFGEVEQPVAGGTAQTLQAR